MLLVAEYERTGSYSATAQHFGVHENTVKRWVERFTLTGDVVNGIPRACLDGGYPCVPGCGSQACRRGVSRPCLRRRELERSSARDP